ncbi:larval cuticle protein A3A-like [Lycorma delicatula]|uniref:larval cuticle protein A3A-like n=1 Tax=Lycorma delicatula TaxID=130591 RepID=UPI003F5101F2
MAKVIFTTLCLVIYVTADAPIGGSYLPPAFGGGIPSAANLYPYPSYIYGVPVGSYKSQDDLSEPPNYSFQYDVSAPEYNVENGHKESRQGDSAHGAYYVLLPDGKKLKIHYTADQGGYKPQISVIDTHRAFGAGASARNPALAYGPPGYY